MISQITQITGFLAVLLWIDFLLVYIIRRAKLPDFFAHIFTGIFFGLILSIVEEVVPFLIYYQFFHFDGIFEFLILAGVFFFFLEFGYRTPVKSYKINLLSDYREFIAYSIPILILFAATFFLIDTVAISLYHIMLIPIIFLAPDLGGILTGQRDDLSTVRKKYQDYIQFSLGQEIISLILFFIFSISINIKLSYLDTIDLLIIFLGLFLFGWVMKSPGKKVQKEKKVQMPYFLLIIGISVIPLFLILQLNLSFVFGGFVTGIMLQKLMRRLKNQNNSIPFSVLRFFLIFPLIGLGLLIVREPDWMQILLQGLIILFILIIAGFLLGLIWLMQQRSFMLPSMLSLFRGEFTFLLLLWGYMHQLISVELIISAFCLTFLLHLLARFGLFRKLISF